MTRRFTRNGACRVDQPRDELTRAYTTGASRRRVSSFLAGGLATALGGRSVTRAKKGKVGVCHRTDDSANPYTYIEVSENAVREHRAHGDAIAPDFQTDPNNCGECGNVGAGETCTAGGCVPTSGCAPGGGCVVGTQNSDCASTSAAPRVCRPSDSNSTCTTTGASGACCLNTAVHRQVGMVVDRVRDPDQDDARLLRRKRVRREPATPPRAIPAPTDRRRRPRPAAPRRLRPRRAAAFAPRGSSGRSPARVALVGGVQQARCDLRRSCACGGRDARSADGVARNGQPLGPEPPDEQLGGELVCPPDELELPVRGTRRRGAGCRAGCSSGPAVDSTLGASRHLVSARIVLPGGASPRDGDTVPPCRAGPQMRA